MDHLPRKLEAKAAIDLALTDARSASMAGFRFRKATAWWNSARDDSSPIFAPATRG
ncbi:hypothetical protein [Enterovirga sp. CN4-39]|uniref:hypothetical protein n=1 Tax=Enterovirga sp. CN4-39 TaxID=3400910 RepID=UPI003C0A7BAF